MIDIEKFKETYKEIDEKAREIRVLPMLHRQEKDYDGWEYEEYNGKEFIIINSSQWVSGCGEETSYLEIPLEEINNSVEWFKEKFQREIDEHEIQQKKIKLEKEQAKEEQAIRFEKIQREKDLETYNRIKKELENERS